MQSKLKDVRKATRTGPLILSSRTVILTSDLGWSEDYEGVFACRKICASMASNLRFLVWPGAWDEVLLIGPGGGAKTVVLHRSRSGSGKQTARSSSLSI